MTPRRHFRFAAAVAGLLFAAAAPAFAQADPHAGHQQQEQSKPSSPATGSAQKPGELPPFIPPVTEETRKAAFPDVEGHAVHDRAMSYYVLFDQLEWQSGRAADGVSWDPLYDTDAVIDLSRVTVVITAGIVDPGPGSPQTVTIAAINP